jgi:hypothetical protein
LRICFSARLAFLDVQKESKLIFIGGALQQQLSDAGYCHQRMACHRMRCHLM